MSEPIKEYNTHKETNKRLDILFRKHNNWLLACAYNKSKDKTISNDLVGELYLYLAEQQNPKLFYRDSFNLLYCYNFIGSRYINYIKRQNKSVHPQQFTDREDVPYDVEYDKRLHDAYDNIKEELKNLKQTKLWPSAKLYELYAFCDITLDELAKEVGISTSTTFLRVKEIKLYLKQKINNPFNEEKGQTGNVN